LAATAVQAAYLLPLAFSRCAILIIIGELLHLEFCFVEQGSAMFGEALAAVVLGDGITMPSSSAKAFS